MDTYHQRLLKTYDYLLRTGEIHSQKDLAKAISKSPQQVSDAFNDRPKRCTLGLMKALAAAFPDILNKDYLMTGEGSVALPDKSTRPHVDSLTAAAGSLSGISEAIETPKALRVSDLIPSYDFSIRAYGDSMLPLIYSGDLLLCRWHRDAFTDDDIDHIFIFDTLDGVLVKQLIGIQPEYLTLHSLNTSHSDIQLPPDTLHCAARVVAIIHSVL